MNPNLLERLFRFGGLVLFDDWESLVWVMFIFIDLAFLLMNIPLKILSLDIMRLLSTFPLNLLTLIILQNELISNENLIDILPLQEVLNRI